MEQREVYITGLSKFVAEKDLRRLFGEVSSRMYGLLTTERDSTIFHSQFGDIKRVNLATDEEGHCKGFAFLEFADEVGVCERDQP